MNLNDFLKKIGVNSFLNLKGEERETYRNLEEAFARLEKEVTIENLKDFLETEIEKLIELLNPDDSEKKKSLIISRLKNYKDVLAFLKMPQRSKKFLEKELEIRAKLIK